MQIIRKCSGEPILVVLCAMLPAILGGKSRDGRIAFEDTLTVGSSELWVAGHSLTGAVAVCSVGGTLKFRDELGPEVTVERRPDEFTLLIERVYARHLAAGFDAAVLLLQESELIASAEPDSAHTGIAITLSGRRGGVQLRWPPMNREDPETEITESEVLERQQARRVAKAEEHFRELVLQIKRKMTALPSGMLVVVDSRGGAEYFANLPRRLAKAQIEHVVAGGLVDDAPAGPLSTAILGEFDSAALR